MLVGNLIGVGLVLAAAASFTGYYTHYTTRRRAAVVQLETQQATRLLAETMDCAKTIFPTGKPPLAVVPPASCAALVLRDATGTPLGDIATATGAWKLSAVCDQDAATDVRSVVVMGSFHRAGKPVADPERGTPVTPLLAPLGARLCAGYLDGDPPTSTRQTVEFGAPVLPRSCDGTRNTLKSVCTTPFYQDVAFVKKFDAPPTVIAIPVDIVALRLDTPTWLPQAGWGCYSLSDQINAYVTNVTETGFRLYCATSSRSIMDKSYPNNNDVCLSDQFTVGRCRWIAFSK